jgi:hypothetical protein
MCLAARLPALLRELWAIQAIRQADYSSHNAILLFLLHPPEHEVAGHALQLLQSLKLTNTLALLAKQIVFTTPT